MTKVAQVDGVQVPAAWSSPYVLKPDRHSSHSVLLRKAGEGKGRTVLDVGAADGYLAKLLTARGFEVTCIEGNPRLAAKAEAACSRVLVADLNREAPKLSSRYDVIIYGDVLEHLQNPLAVLTALNQHLSPGGQVLISVPNVAHLWVRMQLMRGRFEYSDRGILDRTHVRFFTLKTFLEFLKEADLEVEETWATPVPLPLIVPERYQGRVFNLLHGMNAALARAWKTMFAYQFVGVCRRSVSR